jgi:uncharacterized membrane protein
MELISILRGTVALLIGTVALRPYVFVFFAIYLFIAITSIGLKRTLLFTTIAYFTAFACEYSSTHWAFGIPFGVYHYVESTRGRELWIAGVPFMDSLSFTFLSFISFRMAALLLRPLTNNAASARSMSPIIRRPGSLLPTAALAGFLTMYLDIIIDPVTLQGKRWFLGEIYLYPDQGSYFGVTLANFVGWFVVGLIIVVLFTATERGVKGAERARGMWRSRFQDAGPVVLYFGILAFNLFITFHIGETSMGLAGIFITMPLLLLVIFTLRRSQFQSRSDALASIASNGIEELPSPESADLVEIVG